MWDRAWVLDQLVAICISSGPKKRSAEGASISRLVNK
jgi:hypothetical protein